MAGREKKIVIGKKQPASPVPSKERSATPETTKLTASKTELVQIDDAAQKTAATKNSPNNKTNAKAITLKTFPKKVGRKPVNKNLGINLKSSEQKPVKVKQKIAKVLLNSAKNNLDGKKGLLKNGLKPKQIRKRGRPPLLKAVFALETNTEKKPIKRRKKILDGSDNTKKAKLPTNTTNYSSIDDTINSILSQIMIEEEEEEEKIKPKLKKPKIEPSNETIEDVMNDLTYLIKSEDIKQEADDLEPKTEVVKTKKVTRKPKVDVPKRKTIKKTLANIAIDSSAKHLIDMLDLSVKKTDQLSLPILNRRHSIEKISIDPSSDLFSALNNLPRTPTPKAKRTSRVRQSVDSAAILRINPYSTRSDVPKPLRNGKNRKLKNSLLEGLEYKKRKRLCSDFSGSEKSVSKFSGYESDSSFTDTSSFPCSDSMDQKDEHLKVEVKEEVPSTLEAVTQSEVSVNEVDSKISDSPTFVNDLDIIPINGFLHDPIKNENVMDDNSNVCDEVVPMVTDIVKEPSLCDQDIMDSSIEQGIKVPEKSIILDKMKQTFNDVSSEDQDKRTTRATFKKPTPSEDEMQVSPTLFYGSKDNSVVKIDENDCDNSVEQNIFPSNVQSEEENVDYSNLNEQHDKNSELKSSDSNISDKNISVSTDESAENLAIKRDILQALGLQSLKAAEEAKMREKTLKNDYTGTLKTVIKLNRFEKKKGRNSFKMTLHKKNKLKENDAEANMIEDENGHKTLKEIGSSSWRSHGAQSSDTAGALRKSHYSNRSNNMDGSSEHTSDGDGAGADGEDSGKALVIPEKASSFSIHPGRLCKDECSYCFGKFGLFDTPCHIAQIKSIDKQNKILQNEKHLTRDSCLCDACYRHVDRKSNTPSYLNKGSKRNNIIAPGPRQNHCHVLGCGGIATNILRRKWLIKMRKSVREVINIDLENPGLHSIPICTEHYTAVEHLMVCAVCKRKLARNHIHYLGPEMNELNAALNEEGVPVKLIDKPVVCKLCRYFSSLVMKPIEERPENTSEFFKEYKTRLLNIYDVEMTEEDEHTELVKQKVEKEVTKRRKRKSLLNGEPLSTKNVSIHKTIEKAANAISSSNSRSESPSDYMVDYNTLIPNIAMDCGSDIESLKYETTITPVTKLTNMEGTMPEMQASTKTKNKNISNKTSVNAVQRLGSNPCISVRQLFPGEEEVGLQGHIEFGNVKEKTPEGWEKCSSTIQYDHDTKLLWQELQKPYGNQSSFLRHLILLEKYFRGGDLVLSPNASNHSVNYSESVQNRLRAYDNLPLNNSVKKSNSGIVTTKLLTPSVSIVNAANIPKNTPITISQISNISPTPHKSKNPGLPPGLISLHPGTTRPIAPTLIKVPHPQKIKIPLTKNWRPNLIPIDPTKGDKEKKPGYVKVMSGGKPYHITMDDYNRMCAIKKSYDLKQKRLLEAQNNSTSGNSNNYLKPLLPRKGLVISKSSTITSPKSDSITDTTEVENSLEKLDKTVENLESKLSESTTILLPKIPKSLTVIPQTVSHRSTQSSSSNLVTSKPKSASSKS